MGSTVGNWIIYIPNQKAAQIRHRIFSLSIWKENRKKVINARIRKRNELPNLDVKRREKR